MSISPDHKTYSLIWPGQDPKTSNHTAVDTLEGAHRQNRFFERLKSNIRWVPQDGTPLPPEPEVEIDVEEITDANGKQKFVATVYGNRLVKNSMEELQDAIDEL